MPDDVTYARRSARVLLIDAEDRLLLLRNLLFRGQPERGHCWILPGGGVERRETLAQTAARELYEEVGLRVAPAALGATVAYAGGYADLGWRAGEFRDDLFWYRVDAHTVDPSGLTRLEQDMVTGYHWWSLADLAASTDAVYPLRLAELFADLLAGRVPAPPRRLPWHH